MYIHYFKVHFLIMEMDFFDQAAFKIASRFNNDHTRWANKFSFLLLNTKHFLPNVNGEKILLVSIHVSIWIWMTMEIYVKLKISQQKIISCIVRVFQNLSYLKLTLITNCFVLKCLQMKIFTFFYNITPSMFRQF